MPTLSPTAGEKDGAPANTIKLLPEFAARRSYAGTLVIVWAGIVAGAIRAGSDVVEVLTIVGMVELLRVDQVVLLVGEIAANYRSLTLAIVGIIDYAGERRRSYAGPTDYQPSTISIGIVDIDTASRIGVKR